jgi:DNA-binding CsgD family transcriptional regulator
MPITSKILQLLIDDFTQGQLGSKKSVRQSSAISTEENDSLKDFYAESETLIDGVFFFVDLSSLQTLKVLGKPDKLLGLRKSYDPLSIFYSSGTIEQYHIPRKFAEWLKECMDAIPLFYKDKIELSIGGVKVQHTNGEWVTLHVHAFPYKIAKKQQNVIGVQLQDITFLHQSTHVWGRVSYGGVVRQSFSWHSFQEIKKKADLLSSREKEILELIKARKSNEEIGDVLFISKHTVHQHRKNMMARLGAVDTTALIELARMSKLID